MAGPCLSRRLPASPKCHLSRRRLIFDQRSGHTFGRMLNRILNCFSDDLLDIWGHEQVALENLALREQLEIFQRSVRHPKIRQKDRLFWVCRQKVWKEWRSAVVRSSHEKSPDFITAATFLRQQRTDSKQRRNRQTNHSAHLVTSSW